MIAAALKLLGGIVSPVLGLPLAFAGLTRAAKLLIIGAVILLALAVSGWVMWGLGKIDLSKEVASRHALIASFAQYKLDIAAASQANAEGALAEQQAIMNEAAANQQRIEKERDDAKADLDALRAGAAAGDVRVHDSLCKAATATGGRGALVPGTSAAGSALREAAETGANRALDLIAKIDLRDAAIDYWENRANQCQMIQSQR